MAEKANWHFKEGLKLVMMLAYFLFLFSMSEKPPCPKCKRAEVVKYGKVKENQRVLCKVCSFQFTRLTPRGHSDSVKAVVVVLYALGLSMNAIGKMLNVSTQSILNWVRNFAIANYEKPGPKDAIIVELD